MFSLIAGIFCLVAALLSAIGGDVAFTVLNMGCAYINLKLSEII